jgi:phosphatidyl-myo-inositol alpha-mannosyltransferase
MRVGLVTPYSWTVPGGVNHHVEHLAAELETRGHQAWIIAPVGALSPVRRAVDSRRHPNAERFIPMGTSVPIPTNGSRAYLNASPRVVMRMDRAVRSRQFDIMHVHEPFTPSVAMAAVLLAASPVVGTFHAALEKSPAYDSMAWVLRSLIKRIDVRIAVSEAAREFPASRYPGDYRIIPNGVSVERYAPAVNAERVKGRVLFIGRADRRKGLSVLLNAFVRLRERLPYATLVIAGASRRQVADVTRIGFGAPLDLTGVEPLGWVDDDEKVAQLGQAEVLCAPSLAAESFGIVLAEGMAAGVPVAASDLPGYRSVLRDGEAGRLVPPGEPARLADALYDLLQDEAERRRLVACGLAAAEALSWNRVTDSIVEAYEDALALPFRPGLHGRPERPWFGAAILEYMRHPEWREGTAGSSRG